MSASGAFCSTGAPVSTATMRAIICSANSHAPIATPAMGRNSGVCAGVADVMSRVKASQANSLNATARNTLNAAPIALDRHSTMAAAVLFLFMGKIETRI